MSDRRAVLEWPTAQRAELTRSGWSVDPPDPMLAELLNTKHSLAAAQARHGTAIPADLLAFAAQRAALDTGAEVLTVDPPEREPV